MNEPVTVTDSEVQFRTEGEVFAEYRPCIVVHMATWDPIQDFILENAPHLLKGHTVEFVLEDQ